MTQSEAIERLAEYAGHHKIGSGWQEASDSLHPKNETVYTGADYYGWAAETYAKWLAGNVRAVCCEWANSQCATTSELPDRHLKMALKLTHATIAALELAQGEAGNYHEPHERRSI